jgi:hypothetical protein
VIPDPFPIRPRLAEKVAPQLPREPPRRGGSQGVLTWIRPCFAKATQGKPSRRAEPEQRLTRPRHDGVVPLLRQGFAGRSLPS